MFWIKKIERIKKVEIYCFNVSDWMFFDNWKKEFDRRIKIEEEISMDKRKPKVCVISFPSKWKTNRLFLSDLAKILQPITKQLYLISGNLPKEIFNNKVRSVDIGSSPTFSNSFAGILVSALHVLFIQTKMSLRLLRISKNVDIVIFYLAAFYQLPLLTAKLLGKKTVLIQGNSISPEAVLATARKHVIAKFDLWLIHFNCTLADYIVPKAKRLACEYNNYPNKVLLHGARFVDTDNFQSKIKLEDRENIVAYIGRLSAEKGILNFIQSIPIVLKKRNNIKFVIKGDGLLIQEIKEFIRKYPSNVCQSIEWIPHKQLPDYLNKLKLFVLPSFITDTTPQAIQEAMACGTPVLAGTAGDIPEMIKDGETGFILPNSSPECIASNIINSLDYPDLGNIVTNAKKLVEEEYSYEAAVERYSRILEQVLAEDVI